MLSVINHGRTFDPMPCAAPSVRLRIRARHMREAMMRFAIIGASQQRPGQFSEIAIDKARVAVGLLGAALEKQDR